MERRPGSVALKEFLEAIREGVGDLRYAQQAYRAIARLLGSGEAGGWTWRWPSRKNDCKKHEKSWRGLLSQP